MAPGVATCERKEMVLEQAEGDPLEKFFDSESKRGKRSVKVM